jgi:hypothetical protein
MRRSVIPATAGTQGGEVLAREPWAPAFAFAFAGATS